MRNFIKLPLLLLFLLAAVVTEAQQDPLFTQYRSNMLTVNPAYAGSRDALTVAMLIRSQWVGIDGAPETQTLSVHSPVLSPNLGMGFSLVHDKIGPSNQTGLYGDISGRVKVSEDAYLAGGLKVGLNFFRSNLTAIRTNDNGDATFAENTSAVLPNVGIGVYYYTPRFYAGLSSPKLIQNVLYSDNLASGEIYETTEKRHFFAMLGYLYPINANVKLRTTAMARLVSGAPNSYDLTASLIFNDKIWIGAFYRWQESLGLIVEYNFTPQLKLGYSYDYTLTELQQYNSGSHEISLTYDFIYNNDQKIRSPRYF